MCIRDRQNWYACDNAMKGFTDKEREILLTVYREGDTILDNVYNPVSYTHLTR